MQGRYVNELVLTNLLLPVIDLMKSTPPSSAISKVAELELLTIMARHDDHKQGKRQGRYVAREIFAWRLSFYTPDCAVATYFHTLF